MLWIILPAYNEADTFPVLVPKLAASAAGPYRIVVVNDGSSDRSAAVLQELAEQYPIDVITHPLNRGLGETERDAFEYVAGLARPEDVVVRMDCDDTHEPRFIDALVRRIDEGADVAIASRFQPGGGQVGVSRYRATVSWAANVFMRVVFRIPGARDCSCGFRAYRAGLLRSAILVYGNSFLQLRGLGFTSTLETLVKLHLLGARIEEVPFVLRYDQKASESKMVSSVTTLGYITMAILYHWPWRGWASQYRGLRELYRRDAPQALARFGRTRPGQVLADQISR